MRSKALLFKILMALTTFAVVVFFIGLTGFFDARSASTWLPENGFNESETCDSTGAMILLQGYGFSLMANHNGRVAVVDREGEGIIRSITYYGSPDLIIGESGLKNSRALLKDDSTLVIEGRGLNGSIVTISFVAPAEEPKLDIKIKTTYLAETNVAREALIATFEVPVTNVFRKNGTMDTGDFSPEYWLNRQGVRFGMEEHQALIYNTPGVSSLQLDSKENTLVINLEYSNDHPYINFPFQSDNGGKWIDQSASCFPAGYERIDSLSIWFDDLPEAIPRLMLVPDGYLAGYVFTEHADGGSIETHRAVYFGCDTIRCAADAVGGFYGNRIPTTKSVFYTDQTDHPDCIAINDQPDDGRFLDYLLELHSTGLYDICLHTPEDMNSDRMTIEKASRFMNGNFAATTWIDHGMMGGRDNRECFQADAFNTDSEFFCADIWEKYGVKYFWNTAFEFLDPLTPSIKGDVFKLHFRKAAKSFWMHYLTTTELREMNILKASVTASEKYFNRKDFYHLDRRRDEASPVPLYWTNPTRTDSFYSWGTHYVELFNELWTKKADEKVSIEQDRIEEMISNQAVFINHGYFVRGIPGRDLTAIEGGRVILNPYFEDILKYMARRRDEGDLMLTTVRDLLDYQLKRERLDFNYSKDGIIVTNNNNSEIPGLSMAIKNSNVLVNGSVPKSKLSGEDRIFWFDIKANETVTITITPTRDL